MIAAALVALLTAQAPAEAGVRPSPPRPEFVAGRARRGGWRMEAAIGIEAGDPLPRLGLRRCTIAGPGLRLAYAWSRDSRLELGGRGWGFATADIVALEIGGVVYEARMRPVEPVPERYSDVDYPRNLPERAATAPLWPALAPALGVRRTRADPWLNVATLINDMFEVRSIGVRYRTAEGEARTRLPVGGFAHAVSWCETVFRSDRAHLLPARLRGFIPR